MHKIIIILLVMSMNLFASTLLVIVDETRDLNYFDNGIEYSYNRDLNLLINQFSRKDQVVVVRIDEFKNNGFSGSLQIAGAWRYFKRFQNVSRLSKIYMPYVDLRTDLLIWGHEFTTNRLKHYLPRSKFQFHTISTSSCKSAQLDKILIFKKHTRYLLASPENLHLAHFSYSNLVNTLPYSGLLKLKIWAQKSFNRLKQFTESNLVLNIYDLSRVDENICANRSKLKNAIKFKFIKTSFFEDRDEDNIDFLISSCH